MENSPADHWIADRMQHIESSGIRRVFELARSLKNPINLSIGQPDFDVPHRIKEAARQAIEQGHNSYTLTQGIPKLRELIQADIQKQYPGHDREVMITSGTSGGLVMALLTTVNPGDEVILFDPAFVMYPHLIRLAGGVPKWVDTYPTFTIDVNKVREAITPRTRAILVNSPANPTGYVAGRQELRDLATLAAERNVLLISDEIYRLFCYDEPFHSPAEFNEHVLVIDGFSKSYAMTGWRMGFAHGPRRLLNEMIKLQQFTFVCAPSMVQYAGVTAWSEDMTPYVDSYRRKRDFIYQGLKPYYDVTQPGGAFYIFPRAPGGSGSQFVEEAIRNSLLIIPGNVFSKRDTHFRISYAADDRILEQGVDVLQRLAKSTPSQ